jgi:hypothetical protein
MDDSPISQAEVLRQIGSAQDFLKEAPPEINEYIYNAMVEISNVFLRPTQTGGASIKELIGSHLKIPKTSATLDGFVSSVYNFLSSVDELNHQMALAIGPVALIKDMKDPSISIPGLKLPIQFSKNSIIPAINIFLEACRLLVITNRFNNSMLRKILSLVLGIFDIIRGQWKAGVLSLLGIYSNEFVIIGIIGKTISLMYNWISPDIQGKGQNTIYTSIKSIFIGGWLYVLSIVAPEQILQKINNIIPLGDFPQDNIQKIQTLFHDPNIICSLKDNIKLAREEAPIRIILELLNVPNDLDTLCNSTPTVVPSTPTVVSSTPADVTSTPAVVPSTPADVPSTPADVPSTPADVPSTPADVTSTPADVPSTPAVVTSTPADVTSTPAVSDIKLKGGKNPRRFSKFEYI